MRIEMEEDDRNETVTTRPDPTDRVNQRIDESIKSLRDLLEAKIDAVANTADKQDRSFSATINDLKERIVVVEVKLTSERQHKFETSFGTWIAIVASIAALILVTIDFSGILRNIVSR
jgi:hypothetical protein